MQDGVSYQRVSPEELQRVQLELKPNWKQTSHLPI